MTLTAALIAAAVLYLVFRSAHRTDPPDGGAGRGDPARPVDRTLNHGALVELARDGDRGRARRRVAHRRRARRRRQLPVAQRHPWPPGRRRRPADGRRAAPARPPRARLMGRYGPDEFLVVAGPRAVGDLERTALERLRAALATQSLQFDDDGAAAGHRERGARARSRSTARRSPSCSRPSRSTLQEAKASGGDAVRVAGERGRHRPRRRTFDVFQGLVLAVDTKDRYTKRHSEDVARYALFLARRIGLDRGARDDPASPGCSTTSARSASRTRSCASPAGSRADEYDVVKQHVALGDLIVRDLPDIDLVRAGVRHHHERWDGDGYLDALARRGHPARRPDPRGRRCVLGDDDDAAVSQGARRPRGARTTRRRRRARSWTRRW